jgi:phospholipid-translocating ATPase
MYNLAFTSLPIILMGVLDQDVDDKVSLAVPQLYKRGIERLEWTQTKFWLYMVDGMYQSVLVFWSSYLLFAPATGVTWNGLSVDDIRRMGVYVAANAVLIVNAYVLFNTYRWDWLTLLIQFISTFFFFFWTGVWTASTSSQVFYHGAAQVFGQLSFWVLLFVTIVICLLPRFAVKAMQKVYFPRDVDIIREQVNQGRFDYLKHSDDEFPRGPDAAPKPVATAESSASSHAAAATGVAAPRRSSLRRPPTAPAATGSLRRGSDDVEAQAGSPMELVATRLSADLQRLSSDGLAHRLSTSSRPSFERARRSMDRMRPSFEASDHITSAAMLTRTMSSSRAEGSGARRERKRGNTIGEE